MIFNVGVGGSTASRPTEEKIPNDPEGGSGGSPFQAPQAWSAWNQPTSFIGAKGATAMGQGASGMPQVPSGMASGNRAASYSVPSVLRDAGGRAVDPASYGPRTQAAVQSNNQFVDSYNQQKQKSSSALLDSLGKIADMATFTNPYGGPSYTASVS